LGLARASASDFTSARLLLWKCVRTKNKHKPPQSTIHSLSGASSLYDEDDEVLSTVIIFAPVLDFFSPIVALLCSPTVAAQVPSRPQEATINMRLLPIPLLYTLFASVAIVRASGSSGDTAEDGLAEGPEPTTFNGVQVPPLVEIDGEKFNGTVKDGYWFVKHYS